MECPTCLGEMTVDTRDRLHYCNRVSCGNEQGYVSCRWCGVPTPYVGTRECDPCHNMRHNVERNPLLAARVLLAITRGEVDTWGK